MSDKGPREGSVEVDGVRIRYLEAGHGPPLVHLQDPGALGLTAVHDLLCRHFRVVALEMPNDDRSPGLASTIAHALTKLGLDTFNLLGGSLGSTTALWLALQAQARVLALVLEAPVAIPSDGERNEDLEDRLPEFATPMLVLFGTADHIVPPTMGRVYKELMPNSHLVFVYGAGHAISTDRPEAFAEVVIDFLERHEAFVIRRTETVIHP